MVRSPKWSLPFDGNFGQDTGENFNDALRLFDAFTHPLVLDKDLTAPPGGESTGDAYIVGGSATGAWSGKDNDLAVYYYGTYYFLTPWAGLRAYVDDENQTYEFDGTSWTNQVEYGAIQFTPQADPAYSEGLLWYSSDTDSLSYYNDESEITMQIGRETWLHVYNDSGSTITNGQAVYISGNNVGTSLPTIALARADSASTANVVGLATHDIENNSSGYVTVNGVVRGINTVAYNNGDLLYLSPTVAGGVTATKPSRPNFIIDVGFVTFKSAALGEIEVFVKTSLGSLYPEANTVGSNTEICFYNSNGAVDSDANLTWDGTVLTAGGVAFRPGGRVTGTTGDISGIGPVSAGTVIYYTPYHHNVIRIYDGTRFVPHVFSELTNTFSDATDNPAAVGASSVYDLFVWNDGGTLKLGRGPAWTNNTTRSLAITRTPGGLYVNDSAITNGAAQYQGTYVGTFVSNASSQLYHDLYTPSGTDCRCGFWNMYNREQARMRLGGVGASHTYATNAYRNFANQLHSFSVVNGVSQNIHLSGRFTSLTTSGRGAFGFGYNSTTSVINTQAFGNGVPGGATDSAVNGTPCFAAYELNPQFAVFYVNENASAGTTYTAYRGDCEWLADWEF